MTDTDTSILLWTAVGAIATATASVMSVVALAFAVQSIRENSTELKRGRDLRTLDFVSGQFNTVAESRAVLREMALMTENDVLEYVHEYPEKAQHLLQFVYVLNRIGAGIRSEALNADVIFDVWAPEWFIGTYETLRPFLAQELDRRGVGAEASYAFFAWLAEGECPELVGKYPRTARRIRRREARADN